MQGSVKTDNVLMKKNKQFIVKLCHKYVHNINEDIFQIYIILQYTYPFRRESIRQQTVLLLRGEKTNAVVLQIQEHSLTLDSVTHWSYALIWMQKLTTYGICSVAQVCWSRTPSCVKSLINSPFTFHLPVCSRPGVGRLGHAVAHSLLSILDCPFMIQVLSCFPPLHRKNVHL